MNPYSAAVTVMMDQVDGVLMMVALVSAAMLVIGVLITIYAPRLRRVLLAVAAVMYLGEWIWILYLHVGIGIGQH